MNVLSRHALIFVARKAERYRNFLLAGLFVFGFLWLHISLLRRSKLRVRSNSKSLSLGLTLKSGDETSAGAKAYARSWVGFPTLSVKVNCSEVMTSPKKNFLYPQTVPRSPMSSIIEACRRDCGEFTDKFGFARHPQATQEEREFPIAFIILLHKDLDQVLYLLRAIYRPHNVYCLSVDLNAGSELLEAVSAVSGCLRNVFVASHLEHIVYAGFSRLQADLHCMRDLLRHVVRWKYVINMPGQQFPLKSNLEMVKILKLYNGANDVLGDPPSRLLARRYQLRHHLVTDPKTDHPMIYETIRRLRPPPHGLKVVKGSAYGALSRSFVRFALRHPWARDLIKWSRDVESPDEYVWATLHHARNMVVPGGYTGVPQRKPWLTSYTVWKGEDNCASIFVRWICIFSPQDLPKLARQRHFFANKFYIDLNPVALHCLDEYVFNLSITGTVRDLDFYRTLPFVIPTENFDEGLH